MKYDVIKSNYRQGTAMRQVNQFAERQRGIGFFPLILLFALAGAIVLLALKIIPAYIDYFAIKRIITAMATSEEVKSGSVAEIKRSFDRRMVVDYATAINSGDLEVSKENNETIVRAAWTQRIPLFANYTLLIDFSCSTADR
jgi:Domain of unknown function (DUF4845)